MKTDKIIKLIRYAAGIPKSIYVNFRLLPLSQAIYLPIMVSRKTTLQSLSGNVTLEKVRIGIIRIGFGGANMLDYSHDKTLLAITGTVHFKGKSKIAIGAKLLVSGNLYIGKNCSITGDTLIICSKKISIGNDVMIAWKSIIMDTDQHKILDSDHSYINQDKEVTLGDKVWIGAQSFILKGSSIGNGCVVGANTTVTKPFSETNSIIAGNPAKIVKTNIQWV